MSKIGATLAGRDALAAYGLMSTDDTLTWIESDYPHGKYGAIYFVKRSETPNIIEGKKFSPISKAIVDYMEYPYDDSALLEAFELLTLKERRQLNQYIINNNKFYLCKDKRWRAFFKDVLAKEIIKTLLVSKGD